MKRIALALIALLTFVFFVRADSLVISSVKAWPGFRETFPGYLDLPDIVIESNGSILPSGMPISYSNSVYRFTGDISNYSIYIKRDNITVDGAGFTLQGNRSRTSNGLVKAHGIAIEARK